MASTDTRSGFRLPWSSDRPQDDAAGQDAADDAPEATEAPAKPSTAWPESGAVAGTGFQSPRQRLDDALPSPQETPTMIAEQHAVAPRRPSKLMADLAAAIRSTTESARDQRLSQLEGEANSIVEMIRAQRDEGAVGLRRKSDEDIVTIRDWAKAEIARIKEESEARISDRKHLLEQEVADHAAAIEDRCAEVQSTVVGYREAMDAYFERLHTEDDPARLATLAEAMPEPPVLEALSDLDDLPFEGAAARRAAEAAQAEPEPEAVPAAEAVAAGVVEPSFVEHDVPEAVAEPAGLEHDGSEAFADNDIIVSDDRIAHALGITLDAPSSWERAAPETSPAAAQSDDAPVDDAPRWGDGVVAEAPSPQAEASEAVDRDAGTAVAQMGESPEAAADAATPAEVVPEAEAAPATGTPTQEQELDAAAQAALSARMDAGGLETESYQDRLAVLLPGHGIPGADGEPLTTQVVVTGLVSVASIASFKRHLGRVAGVTSVAVASGPDGEFIFNVAHRPDVSLRDAVPTLPGFAARVVSTGEGVVAVTAHDPEAEG